MTAQYAKRVNCRVVLNPFGFCAGNEAVMAHVTASCPGKVLVVGGYLVLQDGVPGYVLAATARFHSTVQRVHGDGAAGAVASAPAAVAALVTQSHAAGAAAGAWEVVSPQFGAVWWYAVSVAPPVGTQAGAVRLQRDPTPGAGRNPFVEAALHTALIALAAQAGWARLASTVGPADARHVHTRITLRADNDFYSQRRALVERGLPLTIAALNSLPPFMPCPRDSETGKAVISKTGLGSSAALVTSLVAAVASHVLSPAGGEPGTSWCDRAWVHAVAQVAHGWAQGKVGSGFDVASAAFGSLAYQRIPAAVMGRLMESVEACAAGGVPGAAKSGDTTAPRTAEAVGAALCALARDPPPADSGWRFGAVSRASNQVGGKGRSTHDYT